MGEAGGSFCSDSSTSPRAQSKISKGEKERTNRRKRTVNHRCLGSKIYLMATILLLMLHDKRGLFISYR